MKIKLTGYLGAFVLLASIASGQSALTDGDVILLGGAALQLGLTRGAVLSRTGDCCVLRKLPNAGDAWEVLSKDPSREYYGEIIFTDEKISFISKAWGSPGDDVFSFVEQLRGALEQFGKEEKRACAIDTGSGRTPALDYRDMTIHCGAKVLRIETSEFSSSDRKGEKSVSITEELGGPWGNY